MRILRDNSYENLPMFFYPYIEEGTLSFRSPTGKGSGFYHLKADRITVSLFHISRTFAAIGFVLDLIFIDSNVEPKGIYEHLSDSNVFHKVKYTRMWEGVDFEIEGNTGELRINCFLDSPVYLSSIVIHGEGKDYIEIDYVGDIIIRHPLGEICISTLIAWQEINKKKVLIPCIFLIDDSNNIIIRLDGNCKMNFPLLIEFALRCN